MILFALSLFACIDGADSGHTSHHTHSETCGEPGDTYSAGMTHDCTDGACSVVLVSADPAPPDKGDNTWTLRVEDTTGAAVTDASVQLVPFMQEHGHGTSPAEFAATADGENYVSEPMNLFMGGLWEVTVQVEADGASHDAVFTFCVQG